MGSKKYDWANFYPRKFRLICVDAEDGPQWVFQHRVLFFFWREHARCHRYDTAQILLAHYRVHYEKEGDI